MAGLSELVAALVNMADDAIERGVDLTPKQMQAALLERYPDTPSTLLPMVFRRLADELNKRGDAIADGA